MLTFHPKLNYILINYLLHKDFKVDDYDQTIKDVQAEVDKL